MSNIIPFNFESSQVRVININGQPWFVAKDIATILGYKNTNDAIRRHCLNVRTDGVAFHDPMGRVQKPAFIPEGDVFRLIMKSKLTTAVKFEKWVMEELLPTIRKNGSYTLENTNSYEFDLTDVDVNQFIKMAHQKVLENEALHATNESLNQRIKEDAPKVEFADRVIASDQLLSMNEAAKALDTGRKRLYDFLREIGFIMKTQPQPYQRYIDCGYFHYKYHTWTDIDGFIRESATTMVTGKGLEAIRRRLYGSPRNNVVNIKGLRPNPLH